MTPESAALEAGRGTARPFAPLLSYAAVVLVLGVAPMAWVQSDPFIIKLASEAVIAALLALSLDVLMGNVGLTSFGHAAWYGFGTYVAGLLAKSVTGELFVLLPLTVAAAGLVALGVGLILVRQIGTAFAILTLAFSQVIFGLVSILSKYTGGEDGLQGVPVPTLAFSQVSRPELWYALLYGTVVACVLLALYVRRTPLGKSWVAIRENPERAEFVGINVFRLKLLAYVLSAMLAALAGALFVTFHGATSPETLSWFESGKILMYVVLGGIGTIIGPVLGGCVFTIAQHYISSYTNAWLIYFGGLFIVIVIVAPGGAFGFFERIAGALRARAQGGSR